VCVLGEAGVRERREDVVDIGAGIVLVLGGARSGKSEVAERLVSRAADGAVTYVATGQAADASVDPEWAARVAAHRLRRPVEWHTIEVGPGGDLGAALESATGTVLVDSLGTWVAGLTDFGSDPASALCPAIEHRRSAGGATILVSEEVGLGVHPSSTLGQQFRDALGTLNRAVADISDHVLLVVAGRVLPLEELGG
jgi:adenosylcobinamide kinase / adenosylcobinamide-phosphate guanylyltransferase